MNLVANARDAMPKGGELAIATRTEGLDQVVLTVRDTGSGMDASVQAHIFDPFFTTKEVGKGTGLGLPIVLDIVRRIGGSIDVESDPGEGTTFTIRLPVHDGAPSATAGIATARGGHETVLVAEDDPLVAEAVLSQLEALGYRTLAAGTIEEAVNLFEENRGRVDLLLTDVMMPGQLGGDLAEQLRDRAPELKVLLMSAHPRNELLRHGRIKADTALLPKPFDEHALDEAVRGVLGRRVLEVLVVDDDPATRETLGDAVTIIGCHAETARDADEAIAVARERGADVVICDLNLGAGRTGHDVARELRLDERLRRAYLIALSGSSSDQDRRRARDAGFDEVLSKPIEFDRLEKVLVRAAI
jgi:CheY-like chemotaxis protein